MAASRTSGTRKRTSAAGGRGAGPTGGGGAGAAEALFWDLAAQLQRGDPRVCEGTIMSGRCLRVGKEFLALADYKGSGLVVKLPGSRVAELIDAGVGKPFAPAGRVFREWLSVPEPNRRRWLALLREGVAFVGGEDASVRCS